MRKNYSSSSKFSLKNYDIDERKNKRDLYYKNATKEAKKQLNSILDRFTDNDVVTRRSLEEYLIRELLKDYREREGYR